MVHAQPYDGLSWWLETLDEDLSPRPSLRGDETCDVAILGGGYSGLWTAYYLLRAEPSLEVTIVESEVCGFGASGRNGSWCSSRFPVNPDVLARRYGPEVARDVIQTMHKTVAEVGRVCEDEGIDAEFRINGILSFARGAEQLPALRATHRAYESLGLGDQNLLLDAEAARERVAVTDIQGALYTPYSGYLHPAKLVRGLAKVVERLGARIYERSPVTSVSRGVDAALVTAQGRVRARRAVIAAGEAYLPKVAGFGRSIVPMSSAIVLTEPLTEAQWAQIGWSGGEGLGSQAYTVDYLTRTLDGRILYGSRGARYLFGSATDGDEADVDAIQKVMHGRLRAWFPVLEGVRFTHGWSGHLGVTRDWTPTVTFDRDDRLARIYGYTGRGVSTSNLCARLLSSLILDRPNDLWKLPISQRRSRNWEPEPLRWMGIRYVQDAFKRMDEARDNGRAPPVDAPVATKLSAQ